MAEGTKLVAEPETKIPLKVPSKSMEQYKSPKVHPKEKKIKS
jgi:hypothetical protein